MDGITGIWSLTPLGFGLGVVVVVYLLRITGKLIPKSTHERELATHKMRGDEWKETALEHRKVNEILRTQNGDLIHANKVVEQLLRSAGPNLGETTQGGGS